MGNKIVYIIVSILVLQLFAMVYLIVIGVSDHEKISQIYEERNQARVEAPVTE